MLRLTAALRCLHVIILATLLAAGCKKNQADGDSAGGGGKADPKGAEAAPSQRTRLHPHRALLDEVSRADLDAGGLLIDFGGPAQHKYTRGSWRTGWGEVRESKQGDTRAWTEVDGRRAFLDLIVPAPAPAAIAVRARSQVPGQKLTFYAGEVALGTVEPGTSWAIFRVALAPDALQPGPLRLELRSGKSAPKTPRAEIDWLWLARDASDSAMPVLTPRIAPMNVEGKARRALIAPDARTYSIYLEPPAGAHLAVDLGAVEEARFQVAVSVDGVADPEILLDQVATAGWQEQVVSLEKFAGQPIQLSLSTRDQKGAVGWGEPEILLQKDPTPPAPAGSPAPAKNVIVLVIDTARADSFGPFAGRDRIVKTPSYDALAEKATVFAAAYDNENWTKPSIATILSGLYPTTHDTKQDSSALPEAVELLSQRLQRDGFATAGFVANGYVSDKFGFQKGWDTWRNYIRENRPSEAEKLFDDALAWLEEHRTGKPGAPFFLYLQTIDPHVVYKVDQKYWGQYYDGSYDGPLGLTISAEQQIALGKKKIPPTEDNLNWLKALYWGEITYHDEHMGRFLAALEEKGGLDDTLLVVTNDHGEELGERGRFGHGHQIYEELVRAPLLMAYDGMFPRGHRVSEVVEHVDLAPTILDVLGREPLAEADGVSFLPLVQGKPYQRPGYAIIEFLDGRRAVRVGSLKLMVSGSSPGELFDLASDPKEETDLGQTRPIARRLAELHLGEGLASPDKKARLRGLAGRRRFRAGTANIDPETRRQLEALGYFGANPTPVNDR